MSIKKPTAEALEVLKNCSIDGLVVKLPEGQLERIVYTEVKKFLEQVGGKWKGGKTQDFVFEEDPTELLQMQANGEGKNLKKEFQFFATPNIIAQMIVCMLGTVTPDMKILEPSAGDGALIKELCSTFDDLFVDCFELMELNRKKLSKIKNANLLGEDFLLAEGLEGKYDIIIANPPFTNNQDITHIWKMYECLKPGGRLITIASPSWTFGSQKKQIQFREWFEGLENTDRQDLDPGQFAESGTNVRTLLLTINKPGSVVKATPVNRSAPMIKDIKLNDIIPDKDQPRKFFDQKELEDLAISIAQHGVIEPILVRPVAGRYIIVFGERRWRASNIAMASNSDITTIPCMVREMTDEEAQELQITENLQRHDPHPMEEATAFEKMLARYDVKGISVRMGRSAKYVATRLQFNSLISGFQELFFKGFIDFSDALKISMINPDIQETIYSERIDEDWREQEDFEIGNLSWYINNNKSNNLDKATFKTEDETLYPEMGACGKCPHNSSNTLELFIDEKNGRRCKMPECFTIKTNKAFSQKIEAAVKEPDVLLVCNTSYINSSEQYKIDVAKETGALVLTKSQDFSTIDNEPLKTWEEYKEENDDDYGDWDSETDEFVPDEKLLRKAYSQYTTEWEADQKDLQVKRATGKIKKAFVVAGPDEGAYIEIVLSDKKANSTSISGAGEDEADKILTRERRAIELDGEKIWEKVRVLASKDKDGFLNITTPLSKIESRAAAMAIYDSLGYQEKEYFREEYLKLEDKGYNDISFAEKLEKQTDKQFEKSMSLLLRLLISGKLFDMGKSHLCSNSRNMGYKVTQEYFPDEVQTINIEQEEIATKRAARVKQRIDAIKPPEPPKKKGKGLKALLND